MSYRDDLEAAHARIRALETEVASYRDREEVASRDGATEADERADMAEELKQLRAIVEERRAQIAELRAERDRLGQRVRVLETERAVLGRSARVLPTLWERNRSFPPRADGKPVDVVCPECRAIGLETQLVRSGEAPGEALIGVICPGCLFTGALRG